MSEMIEWRTGEAQYTREQARAWYTVRDSIGTPLYAYLELACQFCGCPVKDEDRITYDLSARCSFCGQKISAMEPFAAGHIKYR